ncbi:hypothetical protein K8R33_04425, partial [archaeon]|nr:hypothetical protein [archaeon]
LPLVGRGVERTLSFVVHTLVSGEQHIASPCDVDDPDCNDDGFGMGGGDFIGTPSPCLSIGCMCVDSDNWGIFPAWEVIFPFGTGCSVGEVCVVTEGSVDRVCGSLLFSGLYCLEDGVCSTAFGEDYLWSPSDCLAGTEFYTYTTILDGESNSVLSKTDMFGNVVQVQNSVGDTSSFEYDSMGKLINTVDFNGRSHNPDGDDDQFNYNYLGQLIKEYDINYDGFSLYEYDDVGNIEYVTRADGKILYTEYDPLYRGIKVCEVSTIGNDCDSSLSVDLIENYYDEYRNNGGSCREGGTSFGFLCEVIKYEGEYNLRSSLKYSYDSKGNVKEVTEFLGKAGLYGNLEFVTYYDYDDAGNVVWIKFSNNEIVEYGYNRLNQLESVTINGVPQDFEFEYEPTGMIDFINYPDNSLQDFSYNERNWISNIEVKDNEEDLIFGEEYTNYDDVGNLLSISDLFGGGVDFTYDKLYRLDDVSDYGYYDEVEVGFSLNSINYGYDAVGNRLSRLVSGGGDIINTVMDYSYGSNDQLDSADGCSYTYDDVGNMVEKDCGGEIVSYEYDINNLITQIDMVDGSKLMFRYDPLGRRIYKNYLKSNGVDTSKEGLISYYVYCLASNPSLVLDCEIMGDLTHDGRVDISDIIIFSAVYHGHPDYEEYIEEADFWEDGIFNVVGDIVLFSRNLGKSVDLNGCASEEQVMQNREAICSEVCLDPELKSLGLCECPKLPKPLNVRPEVRPYEEPTGGF